MSEPIHIRLKDVELFGSGLKRPEGVMVATDGTVWAAHGDGMLSKIAPDGTATHVGELGGEPNGICIDTDGTIVIANISGSAVQRYYHDGNHEIITDRMGDEPFTTPNFPFIDTKGRLWVTNSTKRLQYLESLDKPEPDGCLCVIRGGETRIVAEGLRFANGVALDAEEKYVYVAETYGRRIVRYEVLDDEGNVGELEEYGPFLGKRGFPDGCAFDVEGNLWITLPAMNAVGVINPAGEWSIVLEDPEGEKLKRPTNLCFGGEDLKTAYVGSLDGESLPKFSVPFAGAALVHQV